MNTNARQHARQSALAHQFADDIGIEKLNYDSDADVWSGSLSNGKVYRFSVTSIGIKIWLNS